MLLCIAWTGYDASAAVQTAEVTRKIWTVFLMMPVIGYILGIAVLLKFYDLRDSSVQLMASYNNLELSYEEAEEKLSSKFGKPAKQNKV